MDNKKSPKYLGQGDIDRKDDLSLMDTFMLGFKPTHLRGKAIEEARRKKKKK